MSRQDDQFLAHYGVLGMRWGVRNNRSDASGDAGGSGGQKSFGKQIGRSGKSKPQSVKDMSDDELRKRLSRIQLERQYKSLSGFDLSNGAKKTTAVLKVVGKVAVKAIAVAAVYGGAEYFGNKYGLDGDKVAALARRMNVVKALFG